MVNDYKGSSNITEAAHRSGNAEFPYKEKP